MRRLWEILLVLLGVALSFYISESIPRATIQRDAGAAVIGLVVCIALVVLWERNELALRSPIIRKETPSHSPNTTYSRPERTDSTTGPARTVHQERVPEKVPDAKPEKVERVYSDATPAELLALGTTPGLTSAERARLLEPHVGKWLRIEGVVDDVNADYKVQAGFVQVAIDVGIDPAKSPILTFFRSDLDRVTALRKGARIRVEGKFSGSGPMGNAVVLDECELLN